MILIKIGQSIGTSRGGFVKKNFNTVIFIVSILLCGPHSFAQVSMFRQGATFQTKGEAVMVSSKDNTLEIAKRHIAIPDFIDLLHSPEFVGLTHDNDAGWTKCRFPLKDELVFPRVTGRVLVFDCKPLSYFGSVSSSS